MAKYRIPIVATSFVEVEANNLDEAITKTYRDRPDIPGIDMSEVAWEIDNWAAVEKDGCVIKDRNGDLYLSDIMDKEKY